MTSSVKVTKKGPIIEVMLDRPKANAVDLVTSREMGEVFEDFRDDPDLRVAIVTGAGEKFFCPGWDLKAAAGGDEVDGDYGAGGFGGMQELPNLNKPIICAVNGICCGGGLEIALSTDIIIAAEHATFALPEIRSGTVADAASIKLPKRIPYQANRWGFVNEIVPPDKLNSRAWEIAELLASGPPLVMAAIKEVVRDAENSKFQDSLNRITSRELPTVDTLYGSEDMHEGFRAFTEKRDPVWKNR
jgi:crotonobetainyl-CoA hydratase